MDRLCTFEGCGRKLYAKGLCSTHYMQQLRGGALAPIAVYVDNTGPCQFASCGRSAEARGMCKGHYQQWKRGEELRKLQPIRQGGNEIEVDPDGVSAWVILTGKRAEVTGRVRIDLDDVKRVEGVRWRSTHGGRSTVPYATSHQFGLLHRYLMDAPEDREVDHISADTLDDRKANLRIVTHAENCQNVAQKGRERLRGVSRQRDGRWIAYATKDGRMHFRAGIESVQQAQEAAVEMRSKLFTHVNEQRHIGGV